MNLPKSKGLTVKVSFILANYGPMSAGTKGKKGGREEERERSFAPLKLNLTCSFSSKEHMSILMSIIFSQSFRYFVLFGGTNLKDAQPEKLSERQAQI